jgi:phosphate starvation-inducible protein PhoH
MQKPIRGAKPKPSSDVTGDKVDKRTKKQLICSLAKKKTKEKFLSESQRKYYDILNNNQITICSGPAGVGKSYIAMKAAVDYYWKKQTLMRK